MPTQGQSADTGRRPYRRGVGIMLLDRTGRVLVARRIDTAEAAWQMPQGGIDRDESPLDAARREMLEEIGTDRAELLAESRFWLRYDLPEEFAAKVWGGRFRGQEQKWFAFRFTGDESDIDLGRGEAEFLEWKWVAMDSLPDLIVSFKRQLYRDLVGEFGHLVEPPTG